MATRFRYSTPPSALNASMIACLTFAVILLVAPFFRPDPWRLPPRGMFENPSIFSKIVAARNHGRNRGDAGQKFYLVKPGLEDSLPRRPGEFHPESLTDPDISLSTYPARATARRLPPFRSQRAPFGEPIGPNQRR
jgi:hypothetical protein